MIQLNTIHKPHRYRLEGCSHHGQSGIHQIKLDDLDRLGDSLEARFQSGKSSVMVSKPLPGIASLEVFRGEQASTNFANDTYRGWGTTDDGREIRLNRSVTIKERSFLPRTLGAGLFYLGYGAATAGLALGPLGAGLAKGGGSMMRRSFRLMHQEKGARYQLFVKNPGAPATDQVVVREAGSILCEHD